MEERVFTSLAAGHNVVYDATNLSHKRRKFIVDRVIYYNHTIYLRCEVFVAPLDVLRKRNSHRSGAECVPDEVFYKMLCSFQFPQFFEGWDEIHMNESNKYELVDMNRSVDFNQMNPHHQLTLWDHSSKARELMKQHYGDAQMCGAAFYHDLGKLYTQTIGDDGAAHYYGHENVGAYMYTLHSFKLDLFSFNEILDILFLINYHMRPYQWSQKTFQKDLQLFGEDRVRKLKLLHYCDEEAH